MQPMNAIDEHKREKSPTGRFHRKITATDAGVVLGRETILVRPTKRVPAGRGFVGEADETRVLSLLATAYGRPVANHAIAKIQRASQLWHQGEKAVAQFHLAFIGLPDADEAVAYRLSLAAKILESGHSPEALIKALALGRIALNVKKYNREQSRVPAGNGRESGRWTSEDSEPAQDNKGFIQLAGIAEDLADAMGGVPRLVTTPKGATQFIGPNGAIIRFDLLPDQYGAQGPHINLQNFPGAPSNIHIPLKP
jgi:hypothetical protein